MKSPVSSAMDYSDEIGELFGKLSTDDELLKLSRGLQAEYITALKDEHCMLPSYNYLLPSGNENGIYVALDVGGSTFRIAVIELFGKGAVPSEEAWNIMKIQSFKIDESVKELKGVAFFDWLAEKIERVLVGTEGLEERCPMSGEGGPMRMGLSWSFPIEHTSLRSGKIQGMGKGFKAMESMLGADLADTVQGACDRRNLPLKLIATINDSAATLLSRGYNTPHTHYGLILGTGMNVAVHLPVGLLPTKLASRTPPQSPNSPGTMPYTISHSHVIVNTELSMFGKSLLPKTRFDNALDAAHPLPGFQPIEMVTSGRYLGEIVRLVVADGITTAQILGGQMPNVFKKPYGLDTEDLAELEESWIEHGEEGAKVVVSRWTGLDVDSIRDDDVTAIVSIVRAVTKRAQQIIAVAVYALSCVRDNAEAKRLAGLATGRHNVEEEDEMVACAGSVIQKYPGFKEGVQEVIDRMCPLDRDRQAKGALGLCIAHESSLLGAAVCAAVYAAVVRAAGDRA